MKRRLVLAAIATAAALAIIACGSAPAAAGSATAAASAVESDPVSDFIREVRRGAPENAMLGIGTSNHSNRGLARTTAEARARAEIARQVEVVVRNMINDYTAGSEAEQQALMQFTETVTQTLAQQTQRGAIVRDENLIGGEQITVVMLTRDAMSNELMSASQSAAALAPHMGSAQWALERMDNALATQNGLEPVVRSHD